METVGLFHSEDPSTSIVVECESLKSEGRRKRKRMGKCIVANVVCFLKGNCKEKGEELEEGL